LAPLTDVAGASETEVRVVWNGAEIGSVRIRNGGQAISPPRLRDAVADGLATHILAHAGIDPDQVLRALRDGPTRGCMR
jgi:hypothetical protein